MLQSRQTFGAVENLRTVTVWGFPPSRKIGLYGDHEAYLALAARR